MKNSLFAAGMNRLRGLALAAVMILATASTALLSGGGAVPAGAGAIAGLAAFAPTATQAAVSMATAARNSRCNTLVTYAGSSAKFKAYNGSRPSGTSAISGGNTLLAGGAFGLTIGSCTNGTLTWDTASFTQSTGGFVNGTPTFFDVTTSGDVVVLRVDACGSAPCWPFTGTVVTGQSLSFTTMTVVEGDL